MTLYDFDPRAAMRLDLLKLAAGDERHALAMLAFVNGVEAKTGVEAVSPFKPMDSAPKDGRELLLSDGEAVWIAEWRAEKTINMVTGEEGVRQGWRSAMMNYGTNSRQPSAWADLPAPMAFGGCMTADAGPDQAA